MHRKGTWWYRKKMTFGCVGFYYNIYNLLLFFKIPHIKILFWNHSCIWNSFIISKKLFTVDFVSQRIFWTKRMYTVICWFLPSFFIFFVIYFVQESQRKMINDVVGSLACNFLWGQQKNSIMCTDISEDFIKVQNNVNVIS